MLKIGDFSKYSRVSVKTLRYYDEIGLLKPIHVEQMTGYRYYSAEQLSVLNRIAGLKDLGLSLEEIGWILAGDLPAEKIVEMLHFKYQATLERLQEEESRLKRVGEWLKNMEKEGIMPDYDVVIKSIEDQNIASVRDVILNYGAVEKLFGELCSYLGRQRVQFTGPPFAIYHDQEYREKQVDVELGVPFSGNLPATTRIKVSRLPGFSHIACLIYKGPYEGISAAYKTLMTWVEVNGYQIAGPNREIYIKGPDQSLKDDPNNYITEIQLPVKK